ELTREALQNLASSIQNSPETPSKHFLLATLDASNGNNTGGDAEWKMLQNDVLVSRSNKDPKKEDLESCHLGHYAACATWLQSQKTPTDSQRLLLGKTFFTLRQYDSAAEVLASVKGVTSENAEASYWLSRTYQALGAAAYAELEQSFAD